MQMLPDGNICSAERIEDGRSLGAQGTANNIEAARVRGRMVGSIA